MNRYDFSMIEFSDGGSSTTEDDPDDWDIPPIKWNEKIAAYLWSVGYYFNHLWYALRGKVHRDFDCF